MKEKTWRELAEKEVERQLEGHTGPITWFCNTYTKDKDIVKKAVKVMAMVKRGEFGEIKKDDSGGAQMQEDMVKRDAMAQKNFKGRGYNELTPNEKEALGDIMSMED